MDNAVISLPIFKLLAISTLTSVIVFSTFTEASAALALPTAQGSTTDIISQGGYVGDLGADSTQGGGIATYTYSELIDLNYIVISGFADLQGTPAISSSVNLKGFYGALYSNESQAVYYMEITATGLTSSDTVPIDVRASGSTGVSLFSNCGCFVSSGYSLSIGSNPPILSVSTSETNGVFDGSQSINLSNIYSFQLNMLYTITMNTYVEAWKYDANDSEINVVAAADPYFQLASTVTDPAQYDLLFSPGINNIPGSAPEPSTWALMLLGAAGLGWATYRRRKSESAALAA